MLWTVVRAEWTSLRRERALWGVLAALALMVAFAAFGGARLVAAERASLEGLARAESQRVAELAARAAEVERGAPPPANADPTDPLLVGQDLLPRAASLPLAPLAPVAVGQRDLLPQALRLTTKARLGAGEQAEAASASRSATGPFDLAFVLVYLLPLAIIALCFDLLAREREQGTLALVLSQPVSLASFVLGKVALRALLLCAAALALALGGALAAGARLTEPGALAACALYGALVVGYVLFWVALSVAVNAWGRSSSANALGLVAAWLALVVVVPGLGSVVVDTLLPAPSRVELVNLTREAARDASARASALEGDHGRRADDDARARAVATQDELARQVRPVLRAFEARLAEQQALVDRLRFASPALLMSEGLTEVAGSGVTRHQRFTAQVDAFHAEHGAFFGERVAARARLGAADYASMPAFRFEEPAARLTAGRVGASVAALVLMAAALAALARSGLRRTASLGLR